MFENENFGNCLQTMHLLQAVRKQALMLKVVDV